MSRARVCVFQIEAPQCKQQACCSKSREAPPLLCFLLALQPTRSLEASLDSLNGRPQTIWPQAAHNSKSEGEEAQEREQGSASAAAAFCLGWQCLDRRRRARVIGRHALASQLWNKIHTYAHLFPRIHMHPHTTDSSHLSLPNSDIDRMLLLRARAWTQGRTQAAAAAAAAAVRNAIAQRARPQQRAFSSSGAGGRRREQPSFSSASSGFGIVFDIDGVLVRGGKQVPGAMDVLEHLAHAQTHPDPAKRVSNVRGLLWGGGGGGGGERSVIPLGMPSLFATRSHVLNPRPNPLPFHTTHNPQPDPLHLHDERGRLPGGAEGARDLPQLFSRALCACARQPGAAVPHAHEGARAGVQG
jgi:hypothetical protein